MKPTEPTPNSMTSTFNINWNKWSPFNRHKPRHSDPTALEEEERILAQALRFDELSRLPAWKEVLEHAIDRVNSEIIRATEQPRDDYFVDWPEIQRIHIIRWNAMRELVDHVRGYVDGAIAERDRLLKERELEREYAGNR